MTKSYEFSPEVRGRAVRMVPEHRGEYPSLWSAFEPIAPKIGGVPQTLLARVRSRACGCNVAPVTRGGPLP